MQPPWRSGAAAQLLEYIYVCVVRPVRRMCVCAVEKEWQSERARVRMSFLFEFVFIGEHSSYSYINIYIYRYIPSIFHIHNTVTAGCAGMGVIVT